MIEPLLEDISDVLSLLSKLVNRVDGPEHRENLRELERELSRHFAGICSTTLDPGTKAYEVVERAAKEAKKNMRALTLEKAGDQQVVEAVGPVSSLIDSLSRLLV